MPLPVQVAASAQKLPETELQRALKKAREGFYSTAFFSFFINLLLFVSPLYMLQVYDRVLTSRSAPTLALITVVAIGCLVVLAGLEAVRSRILVRTGVMIDKSLSHRIFDTVLHQTVQRPGGGHQQALRDLDSLREFLTGSGLLAFCDAPWMPLFIAVAFSMHPMLGVVSLIGAIVIFTFAVINNMVTQKSLKKATSEAIAANNFVSTSLRNAEVLEAMGMMRPIRGRWSHRHKKVIALQSKASDGASAVLAMSKAFRMALQVAILGVGAYLAIHREISPGMMIAASIIMGRALAPVEMAVANWKGFVVARTAYERLQTLLRSSPPPQKYMSLPHPKGHLVSQQLAVAPPGSTRLALRGVSLEIKAGESLGVIGPSAAGKSTLARALVGIWLPVQGVVRLDGNDIRYWNREDLGQHIGYLPQDVELFDGTVAENISRFAEDAHPDKVIAAAKKAGVHQMIQTLPAGYNSRIGLGGSALSGGQRQRMALARAVYDDPAVVVMDEPNASLDNDGEAALMHALKDMKDAGQTVAIITHKPSLLQGVDKILVLREGLVEMMGPCADILSRFTRPSGNVAPQS